MASERDWTGDVMAQKTDTASGELIDARAAARLLGVSYVCVVNWLHNGELPRVKLPSADGRGHLRRLLVRRADVTAFIERHVER